MEIALFWVGFSVVVGVLASGRGRSGFGWFLLAVLLSPLLAGALALALPAVRAAGLKPDRAAEIEAEERLRAEIRAKIASEAAASTQGGQTAAPDDPDAPWRRAMREPRWRD